MGGTGTLSAERPTARPAGPFVDRLQAAGFDFFVGVPCSLVGPVTCGHAVDSSAIVTTSFGTALVSRCNSSTASNDSLPPL